MTFLTQPYAESIVENTHFEIEFAHLRSSIFGRRRKIKLKKKMQKKKDQFIIHLRYDKKTLVNVYIDNPTTKSWKEIVQSIENASKKERVGEFGVLMNEGEVIDSKQKFLQLFNQEDQEEVYETDLELVMNDPIEYYVLFEKKKLGPFSIHSGSNWTLLREIICSEVKLESSQLYILLTDPSNPRNFLECNSENWDSLKYSASEKKLALVFQVRSVLPTWPATEVSCYIPPEELVEIASKKNGEGVLGEGAQGSVFLRLRRGNECVVEKLLKLPDNIDEGDKLKMEQYQRLLVNELEVCKSLPQHQNICQFVGYTIRPNSKFPSLIMEYVPDGSLNDLLKDKQKSNFLSEGQKLDIMFQVSTAMDFLHNLRTPKQDTMRLIHRDLHPGNILLKRIANGKFEVKITDFNLSRAVTNYYSSKRRTKAESEKRGERPAVNTFCLAPEVVCHSSKTRLNFTTATDVWAFGVAMFTLWAPGNSIWGLRTANQVMEALRDGNGPQDTWKKIWELMELPLSIKEIISDCVQLDPSLRPNFITICKLVHEQFGKVKTTVEKIVDKGKEGKYFFKFKESDLPEKNPWPAKCISELPNGANAIIEFFDPLPLPEEKPQDEEEDSDTSEIE